MAERQETSVMVSIQEILRDAQHREEQEKVEAERRAREEEQRRLDDIRKRQEEEESRLRSEEEDRQRRAYEEQRRQAEINAMQEAAVQRARAEAEAQARLAEMAARQEHERQLHALSQDKHKKRLTFILVGLGAFLFIGIILTTVFVKKSMDETAALKAQAAQLQSQIDDSNAKEARLKAELENTKDPEKIAALQQQLDAEKARLQELEQQKRNPGVGGGGYRPVGGGGGAGSKPTGGSGKPCNCTPGDPLCSCL
jgi:colicin import membrane protein